MLRLRMASVLLLVFSLLHRSPDLCASLDAEGWALLRFRERVEADPYGALSNWGGGGCSLDPCSWFGVECSGDGRVIALNLKDLCLKGTLTPELRKLIHMKSLILSNNSFYGTIPGEIRHLQKLQVLDLGHNNLSGPFPSDLGRILSLEILVLKSNKFINNLSPELHDLIMLSEIQVDEELLSSNRGSISRDVKSATIRRLLQVVNKNRGRHRRRGKNHRRALAPAPSPIPPKLNFPFPSMPPSPSHSPVVPPSLAPIPQSTVSLPFLRNKFLDPKPSPLPFNKPPSPGLKDIPHFDAPQRNTSVMIPSPSEGTSTDAKRTLWPIYMSVAGGISFLIVLSATYIFCCRAKKGVTVMPWSTGLSGQLQKALVTGVPSLKRSELERACEYFSNIIGSLSGCMLYKGTLSSGVEIAVTSTMITSAKDWSVQSEAQFREKISMLSKMNHKNFMNLLGYCEEEEPFTRIMVFEYSPNGTLFEHLHIREAEHLDWATRLRIAMGIAYCLEHMCQLTPPVILRNLNSSSIYLTDDYAAKISDLGFWNDETETEPTWESPDLLDAPLSSPESVVYKFAIILLEMISGRRPFSKDDGLLVLWASSYFTGERPLREMVDSTLESFREEDVSALCEVIGPCINPDPRERPTMAEVVSRLRRITAIPPHGATPKVSPLWWAELEIISGEAS